MGVLAYIGRICTIKTHIFLVWPYMYVLFVVRWLDGWKVVPSWQNAEKNETLTQQPRSSRQRRAGRPNKRPLSPHSNRKGVPWCKGSSSIASF